MIHITKRILHSLLLFCFICVTYNKSFAVEANASKHLLWEVTSSKNTVYILGSVHLLKEKISPLNGLFEETFKKTKILVLEAHPEKMALPETQQMTLNNAVFPAGQSLKKNISAKTYETTKQAASDLGMDINTLDRFKPWFVAVTLTSLQLKKLGFNPEFGVDVYFYNLAKAQNKKIISLETPAFQINLFSGMPLKTQDLLLQQAMEDMHVMEQDFLKLINAWQKGDVQGLEKILLDSFKGFPEVFDRIIVKRNKTWVKKIHRFLRQDESYFIVVGAGHLLGDQGVIHLLKNKGYSIKQL